MSYEPPQVNINQQFIPSAVQSTQPLSALIIGPQYALNRYGVSAEKPNTVVGAYNPSANTNYAYPNAPTGSTVDQDYVKVFFEQAKAQYFPNTGLGTVTPTITKVAGFSNRIVASGIVFAGTGTSSVFGTRGVQVGDSITVADSSHSVVSTITGLIVDAPVAVVGTTTYPVGDAAVTVGGAYTGSSSITYILTVVRAGGLFGDVDVTVNNCALVSVTSTNIDSSPTVNALTTAIPVGSYGITATFADHITLGLGDVYTIPITVTASGAVHTIQTADNLDIIGSSGINVHLFETIASLSVPQLATTVGDVTNWTTSSTALTLNQNIVVTNPLLTSGSIMVPLPVVSAQVFIEHRDLVTTNTVSLSSVKYATDVATVLGTVDVDNTLAQGVYDAALTSNGARVYFIGVASNDLTGYNAALQVAAATNIPYSLVPLTFDNSIQEAVISQVNSLSTPQQAKWRIAWLSTPLALTSTLYGVKSDTTNWVATVSADPLAVGTVYSLVTVAGATFITDGVRAGDSLLINYRLDLNGNSVYDTYTVSAVRTQTTFVTTVPFNAAITIATKAEVVRNFTKAEQAANLAAVSSGYGNRRVRNVFPDTFKSGNVTKQGYFLAASLAGLRSGTTPHQGLTNVPVLGPTDVSKTISYFDQDQLNVIAGAGTWIVTQTAIGATPYTRHQLTTDTSSLKTQEDSITTNVDSISYGLQKAVAPFIGVYNVNPGSIILVKDAIDAECTYFMTETYTVQAGNQLNSYTINSLAPSATFADRIEASVALGAPNPINNETLTLLV